MKKKLTEGEIKRQLSQIGFYNSADGIKLSDKVTARKQIFVRVELGDTFDGMSIDEAIKKLKEFSDIKEAKISAGVEGYYDSDMKMTFDIEYYRFETDEEYNERIQNQIQSDYRSWKAQYDKLNKQLEEIQQTKLSEHAQQEATLRELAKKLGYKVTK